MRRSWAGITVISVLMTTSGCNREERGPILAGGREVKSWILDLHDSKPQVRRHAVLKLGNVGDADPSVGDALAEALRDPDPLVRQDAVRAVAELAKPGQAIMSQLRIISETDRDSLARDFAKRAIARFKKTK